jgi:hypothetical protein
MAEVTITGAADEMSSAVQSVADSEKARREQAEEDARQAEEEYQKQQKEIAQEVVEVKEEDTPVTESFDFGKAFKDLADTLTAKLDDMKPKPSDEEARATRLAELKAELAELAPEEEKPVQPGTPPKKAAKTQKPAAPDAGTGDTSGDDKPEGTTKKGWASWW